MNKTGGEGLGKPAALLASSGLVHGCPLGAQALGGVNDRCIVNVSTSQGHTATSALETQCSDS